jgi:signal transduction histidine kinase
MLNKNIDLKNGSFSFSDYFKINIDIDELTKEFGYKFQKSKLPFEDVNAIVDENLKIDIDMLLEYIDFDTEIAVREFLISPIFISLMKRTKFKLKSEKSVYFDKRLRGILDYYIEAESNLVIIEAKHKDLNSGFKQLTMELIALDKLTDEKAKKIFGVLTIGTDWIFATIDREKKIITKDLKVYRVPEELDKLLGILNFIIKS